MVNRAGSFPLGAEEDSGAADATEASASVTASS